MKKVTKTIRGLDLSLWQLARGVAINQDKTIGEWLNEAIKEKLSKKGEGNEVSLYLH